MIAPLRQRHRNMIIAVGAVVMLGMLVAMDSWTARPVAATAGENTSSWTAVSWAGASDSPLTTNPETTVRLARRREAGSQRIFVRRGHKLTAPDVLVYWAPRSGGEGPLAADAVLLGPLDDAGTHAWDLPASHMPGVLIFFSLGHREEILTVRVAEVYSIEP